MVEHYKPDFALWHNPANHSEKGYAKVADGYPAEYYAHHIENATLTGYAKKITERRAAAAAEKAAAADASGEATEEEGSLD
jgi:hypothetical protein